MDVAIHPRVAFVDTTVANLPEEQYLYFAKAHKSYDAQKWN